MAGVGVFWEGRRALCILFCRRERLGSVVYFVWLLSVCNILGLSGCQAVVIGVVLRAHENLAGHCVLVGVFFMHRAGVSSTPLAPFLAHFRRPRGYIGRLWSLRAVQGKNVLQAGISKKGRQGATATRFQQVHDFNDTRCQSSLGSRA